MAAPQRMTASLGVLTLIVSLLAACARPGERAAAAIGSPGPAQAAYDVELRASHRGARWEGSQQIAFTNTSTDALTRVWLRLWANGVDGCEPRAVRIGGVDGGTLGSVRRRCTAVAVDLSSPLDPGQRASIWFDLRIDVPQRNDRFGAHEGVALLGGALPVLGVLDDGGWHLDPYVDIGESFYSLTSRYRVTLDVAAKLMTAATGVRVHEEVAGGRVARMYRAADVRDFAWAFGRLQRVVGQSAAGTRIQVWRQPSIVTESQADRVLETAVTSMDTFSEAFGAYPYPEVDIVTSAFTAFGGMEYPQIVFSNLDRATVAHELAHQWWWGIVGNDEFAEPWLDESLASWSQFLPFSPWRNCGSYDWPSPTARLTNDMAYWRAHAGEYGTIYGGGGCMLAALAHELGTARLTQALGDYARARWLGVTTADDLRATLEAAAAEAAPDLDMAAFWAEWRAD